MLIKVLTPCHATSEFFTTAYKYFIESCGKFNIDFEVYGIGAPYYPSWIDIKLLNLLHTVENIPEEYTHVLFTDGLDAFFVTGLDEISIKYQDMGSPKLLVSASPSPQNAPVSYSGSYSHIHCGQFIAEKDYLKDVLNTLLNISKELQLGDDAHVWRYAYDNKKIDAVLDTGCYIFQVVEVEGDNGEHVHVISADKLHWSKDSRLFNTITCSYPCMLHLPGGYSDPHFGKLDLVRGWYEQF